MKSYIERTGDTVAKAYEEGNIPAIEEYVIRDVEAHIICLRSWKDIQFIEGKYKNALPRNWTI